jgi:hypothetical protein
VQQLQHLALGDRVGGVGQDPHHLHAVELDHQLEAARVQEVPDQHAGRIAEHRIGGAAAAPQLGRIDHVVVQQGRGVDEFDHRRQLPGVVPAMIERARGQQQQHRPQALAARADDVLGDLVDQGHVRGQAAADQRVDPGHVLAHQRLDFRQGQGEVGRGAGIHARSGVGERGL